MRPIGSSVFGRALAALGAAALLAGVTPVLAVDDDEPRKPKIDCTKPKNKTKPDCKPHHAASDDDAIINGAYWLAQVGRYSESLALLATVKNRENPRALNSMGFVTRKLGDVDGALPYYARALAIKPDYVQARAYLGEAYLAKDDLAHAREQLAEIARRCGTACFAYGELAREIRAYEAAHPVRG